MFSALIIHDFRLPASICLLFLAFVFVAIKLFAKRAPRKKQDVAPAVPDNETAAWLAETLERDRIEQLAKQKRAALSAERRSSKRRRKTDSLLD
jgi:hypothetical protein